MATFHIKLSRPPDGLTRKFVDAAPPSWAKLAARIESLYHIPLADIAVSYIDQDGDEVTLSSEEELQEYYKLLPPVSGEPTVIRFDVRDLAERNKPLPATPRSSGVGASAGAGYRGTFGQGIPMMFEVEDDWQRVAPGLGSVFLAGHETPDDSDGPHAFVELIESDVDGSRARDEDRQSAVSLADSELTASTPTPDKGKGKARSSRSSTESVVSAQGPEKHPVHVMEIDSDTSTPEGTVRTGKSTPVSCRNSTPRPVSTGADAAPDPPLPDLDDVPTTPTASLTNDVANLFGTLSTVFASHPELSEGVRNIVHNATSGTYWHAHRESVARAADEIRRSALAGSADARQIGMDARRAAEEAAGRRVAEAIANVVRVIGDVTGGAAGATGPDTSTPRSRRGSGHPRGSHPHDFGRHGHHHHRRPSPPGEGWDDMLADLEPPEWMGSWGHGRGGLGRGGRHRSSWHHGSRSDRMSADGLAPPPPLPPPPPFAHPPPPGPPPPGPPPPVSAPPPPPRPRSPPSSVPRRHAHVPPSRSPSPRLPPPPGPPPPHGPPPSPWATHGGRGYWPGHPFHPYRHAHHRSDIFGAFPPRDPRTGGPFGVPPPPPPGAAWGFPPFVPPPPPHPPTSRTWPMSGWTPHDMDIDEPDTADEHAEVTMFAASPTQSPQQLRESLKDAKERYVAEKEKYRRERALRRLERERMRNRSGERSVHPEDSDVAMTDGEAPDSAQPVTSEEDRTPEKKKAGDAPAANSPLQIISTARGPFPQLEMFPVPVRRSHTMHGTGQRNPAVASVSSAAVDVITRRLNDVRSSLHFHDSRSLTRAAADGLHCRRVPEHPRADQHARSAERPAFAGGGGHDCDGRT